MSYYIYHICLFTTVFFSPCFIRHFIIHPKQYKLNSKYYLYPEYATNYFDGPFDKRKSKINKTHPQKKVKFIHIERSSLKIITVHELASQNLTLKMRNRGKKNSTNFLLLTNIFVKIKPALFLKLLVLLLSFKLNYKYIYKLYYM